MTYSIQFVRAYTTQLSAAFCNYTKRARTPPVGHRALKMRNAADNFDAKIERALEQSDRSWEARPKGSPGRKFPRLRRGS